MPPSNSTLAIQQTFIDPAVLKRSIIGDYHRIDLWEDVSELDWEDWHWQVKNRIRTTEDLSHLIKLTSEEEEGIKKSHGRLSLAITP